MTREALATEVRLTELRMAFARTELRTTTHARRRARLRQDLVELERTLGRLVVELGAAAQDEGGAQ